MYSVSLLCSIGSHSTSDDQTGYQDMQEVAHWKEFNDPVDRLQRYMENRGIWTEVCGYGYSNVGMYMENRGIWTEVCGHGYVHGEQEECTEVYVCGYWYSKVGVYMEQQTSIWVCSEVCGYVHGEQRDMYRGRCGYVQCITGCLTL